MNFGTKLKAMKTNTYELLAVSFILKLLKVRTLFRCENRNQEKAIRCPYRGNAAVLRAALVGLYYKINIMIEN